MIIAALAMGACGGGGGGGSTSPDPAAAFAGSWVFKDGSVTPSCSGTTIAAIDLTGNTASVTKIDAGHVALAFTNPQLTCRINFTVSESTATAEAAQACTISAMGTTIPVAITSWMMTVSGPSISMSMSGNANLFILTCAPTGKGTLIQPSG